MKELSELIRLNKTIRVIGFDDAPFCKKHNLEVNIGGVVCANTRFEGMLWGEVSKDGDNATEVVSQLLEQSKFHQQVNLVLLDGIAFGGFNIVDLNSLSKRLNRPCIAVMRRLPDLAAIDSALKIFNDYQRRVALLKKAGEIYQIKGFTFQVAGTDANTAAVALNQLTDKGKVPEALRLAHLIGSAIKTGQSSNRA